MQPFADVRARRPMAWCLKRYRRTRRNVSFRHKADGKRSIRNGPMPNLGFSLHRSYSATRRARGARHGCNSIRNVDSLIRAAGNHPQPGLKGLISGLLTATAIALVIAASYAVLR
jgi:hypothetical protein